jgi:hypothetical protein
MALSSTKSGSGWGEGEGGGWYHIGARTVKYGTPTLPSCDRLHRTVRTPLDSNACTFQPALFVHVRPPTQALLLAQVGEIVLHLFTSVSVCVRCIIENGGDSARRVC